MGRNWNEGLNDNTVEVNERWVVESTTIYTSLIISYYRHRQLALLSGLLLRLPAGIGCLLLLLRRLRFLDRIIANPASIIIHVHHVPSSCSSLLDRFL